MTSQKRKIRSWFDLLACHINEKFKHYAERDNISITRKKHNGLKLF